MKQCFARCEKEYGGKVTNKGSDAENCAKGCAGMEAGKVTDYNKICGLPLAQRLSTCQSDCKSASSNPQRVADCNYGCGFWKEVRCGSSLE